MVEFLIVCLCVIVLFVALHLRPLVGAEIDALADKRRATAIDRYYFWSNMKIVADPQFKSAMDKNGALHRLSRPLSAFPALAAGLLKSKKHEWIVFGFAKDRRVELMYFNKGPNNATVTPFLTLKQLLVLAQQEQANTVLCLHNHPNGVLSPSRQDVISAEAIAKALNLAGVSLYEFICGRGYFAQYYRSVPDVFLPLSDFKSAIVAVNGLSKTQNVRLHLERLSRWTSAA